MGPLTEGFHFLGLNFKVNQPPSQEGTAFVKNSVAQTQDCQSHVNITLHERGCVRALEKVNGMGADAESPEKVRRYLILWASWWSRMAENISKSDCLKRWVERAEDKNPSLAHHGVLPVQPLFFKGTGHHRTC